MYPYKIIWDLDLYSILITVGLIACMILIRVLSDKRGLSAKWQNFILVTMVFAVVIGYGSAVVFQALYNMERDGGFHITKSTGQTFYGGLIGGAVAFLLIYFGVGYPLFRDNEHLRNFPDLMSIAACGVTVAHGFGRLGCLMAGCCYGRATDAWYGIEMVGIGKRIPVQLFEAIFLFLLCGWLVIRYCEGRRCGMPLYMMLYGTWRFFAEYLRDDYRGNSLVSFLTPSQLISLVRADPSDRRGDCRACRAPAGGTGRSLPGGAACRPGNGDAGRRRGRAGGNTGSSPGDSCGAGYGVAGGQRGAC